MKNLSDFLITGLVACALLAGVSKSTAQEGETHGFLNIVNLVPSTHKCEIGLAGKDTVPGGLASAASTGWFIVPTGSLPLSLEIEGFDAGSGNIDLADNQSSVFVIFLEPNPRLDKDGKPLRPKIKAKRCESLGDKTGFYLMLMSFCPGENRFMVGPNPFSIKLYESMEIPKWNGGGFKITRNQEAVGEIPTETEKDPFYLFIGTDHAGKYCSTLVRAGKQVLPPWMKPKVPKP